MATEPTATNHTVVGNYRHPVFQIKQLHEEQFLYRTVNKKTTSCFIVLGGGREGMICVSGGGGVTLIHFLGGGKEEKGMIIRN